MDRSDKWAALGILRRAAVSSRCDSPAFVHKNIDDQSDVSSDLFYKSDELSEVSNNITSAGVDSCRYSSVPLPSYTPISNFDVIYANQTSYSMTTFATFNEADQEVRALSFILSTLESSRVISFDHPIERNRPNAARPLQHVAKCLVRKVYDNVAVGALVKGDKYCAIAQLCGASNPEAEDKNKL
jgi:hypothetical protein